MFADLYRSIFNWRTVRAFGAVQLLTRASYAMLVLVPLLAGLWPFAHFVIGESKQELLRYADNLDRKAEQLKITYPLTEPERGAAMSNPRAPSQQKIDIKVAGDLTEAAEHLTSAAMDLRHTAGMLPGFLPSVWVYGFFTALAVAFGHLVYQTSAPRTVQRYSLEEYQDERVTTFARSPTTDIINDADNRIERAISNPGTFLNRKAVDCIRTVIPVIVEFNQRVLATQEDWGRIAAAADIQSLIYAARNKLTQIGSFYALEFLKMLAQNNNTISRLMRNNMPINTSINLEVVSYIVDQHVLPPFKSKDEEQRKLHNREKIWIAARIQYIDESRSRLLLSATAFVFYLIALGLILWLSWGQIISVLTAAGWIASAHAG